VSIEVARRRPRNDRDVGLRSGARAQDEWELLADRRAAYDRTQQLGDALHRGRVPRTLRRDCHDHPFEQLDPVVLREDTFVDEREVALGGEMPRKDRDRRGGLLHVARA
jgi:hypothetical protein